MKSIFFVSFCAVLKILLVAMTGCYLGKKDIMNAAARRAISKIILKVMLPSLLFTSLLQSVNAGNIRQYAWIPLCAIIIAVVGFILAIVMTKLFRVSKDNLRYCRVASSLCNSSYIPMPLLATVCMTAPLFAANPAQAQAASFTYVSVFLLTHSPMLWMFGYPYLSGNSWKEVRLNQIITPPTIASFCGIFVALTPIRQVFIGEHAPLAVVIDTMQLLSQGVFPCALLVLGANLADPPAKNERIHWNDFASLILTKLILLPVFGTFMTMALWRLGWIPRDGICALVLMVECAVPPANNLIIMCQMHEKGEGAMARLLIVAYCLAVPLLTAWIMFFLNLIQSWMT